MPASLFSVLLFALSLLVPMRSIPAPACEPVPAPGCNGCLGAGGSASATGGTCGGMVSIAVTVDAGVCKWFQGVDPNDIRCRQAWPCLPHITRTWSGLTAGSPMDFCVVVGGETLCLAPQPSAGSGSGSDTRTSVGLGCPDSRDFTVESPSCGLFASAQATCSACL